HHPPHPNPTPPERRDPPHGARPTRAMRHHHNGPASLGLFTHVPHATSHRKTIRPGTMAHRSRINLRMENPDRAWGPVPGWRSKVRLDLEGVNTLDSDQNHRLL